MFFLKRIFFIILILTSSLYSYNYELSIATIFQNEAPYLKEWIEFHRLQGVEHFYMYNNESQDNYEEVLEPYIKEGVVELIEWPNLWTDVPFYKKCQRYAINDALNRSRSITKWLAIIDTDEFMFPLEEQTILSFLEKHCDSYSGLCINWQCYGTSNVTLEPGELLIEKLTLKAPIYHKKNLDYKSIVKPDDVIHCPNQHGCVFYDGKYAVNSNMEIVTLEFKWTYIDKVRINHYWLKDEGFFRKYKADRLSKRGYSPERIQSLVDEFNQVEDTSIFKYIPTLKNVMEII